MPALIDSAPDCVTSVGGAKPADDSADFIIQAAYEKCAGFMTFGPGSTYGDEGASAATAYYVLTGIAIAATLLAFVAWVIFERRRLTTRARLGLPGDGTGPGPAPTTTATP